MTPKLSSIKLIAFLILFSGAFGASANEEALLPEVIKSAHPELNRCGTAPYRKFFLKIYYAELQTMGECASTMDFEVPGVVTLEFTMGISQGMLLDYIQDEWEYLETDPDKTQVWMEQLSTIITDVEDEDKLALFVVPGESGTFYDADKVIGSMDDPEFHRAFAEIWLGERSRFTRQRKKLLMLENQ